MNDCGSATKHGVSTRVRGLCVVAAVAALAAVGFGLLGSGQTGRGAAFDVQALGGPQRALPAVHTSTFTATIGARGYTAGTGARAVTVAAVGGGAGRWTPHVHGATRATPYGHETITLTPNAAEQLSTVDRHLGPKTWSWELRGIDLNPTLRADGSVWFGPRIATHILPVAIFDQVGNDVTP